MSKQNDAILKLAIRIRLEGIDTPERGQVFGTKAKDSFGVARTRSAAATEGLRGIYLNAVRNAKQALEIYYSRADALPAHVHRRSQIESLRKDLGIGSDSGGGTAAGPWVTSEEAVRVINDIVQLSEQYQEVASDEVNASVDNFIGTLIDDLRASSKPSIDNAAFQNSARQNLDRESNAFIATISELVGEQHSNSE